MSGDVKFVVIGDDLTPHTIDADDFSIDKDGVLRMLKEREEVAAWASCRWTSVRKTPAAQ